MLTAEHHCYVLLQCMSLHYFLFKMATDGWRIWLPRKPCVSDPARDYSTHGEPAIVRVINTMTAVRTNLLLVRFCNCQLSALGVFDKECIRVGTFCTQINPYLLHHSCVIMNRASV